jgi:hypothetical protein
MASNNISELESKNESASKTPDIVLVSDTKDSDVELLAEPPTVYSKLSVTLMVIFSGLTIHSDGFYIRTYP